MTRFTQLFQMLCLAILLLNCWSTARAQSNYVANTANSNNPGAFNTLVGPQTGNTTMTGSGNTVMGFNAGRTNTTGNFNSFLGDNSGTANTTGSSNAFIGYGAGQSNTAGTYNTFIGSYAGAINKTGNFNAFMGINAGYNNTIGSQNAFLGNSAGYRNTIGAGNAFVGASAGFFNNSGYSNAALGVSASYTNVSGHNNVAIGDSAGLNNTVSANVFIGSKAGYTNTTGYTNTFLGYQADAGAGNLNNATAIGNNAKVNISNALVLGNGANVGIGTSAPTARLHIATGRPGQAGLRLENLTSATTASVTNQTKFLTVDANGNVILGSLNSSARVSADESLWQRSGSSLQNTGGESVLIGDNISQTPAGYKLYVEQGILTEKVKVAVKNTSEWSDYVFASGYSLRSLSEVGAYIKANKHLPGVPSAEEMVLRGNDLQQTDAKLLEKIEELTLYMLEQQKQITTLQAQNRQILRQLTPRTISQHNR